VRGIEYSGTLPGEEVRLVDRVASSGVVEFEFGLLGVGSEPSWIWIPRLLEVTEENERLLAPFR
jgi:hypothetical protein